MMVERQVFVVFMVVFLCLPKIGFCHCDGQEQAEGSYYLEEDYLPVHEEESQSSVHENHNCACCQHECSHGDDTQGKGTIVPNRLNDLYMTTNAVRAPAFFDDCGSWASKLRNTERLSKQGIHAIYSVFQI